MSAPKKMRLQRFLAQAGVASRRKAEEHILAGRVAVNDRIVTELGTTVDPTRDKVTFEGERLVAEEQLWILLNKPKGTVCTADDPEGRETVLDLVGQQGVRLYPVGRLDYNTEGVLFLTNDGDLAHALMHPSNQIQRVYHVKLKGIVDPDDLQRLRDGVTLDTGENVSAQIMILGTTEFHSWIEMRLTQGLNHQIHRMVACIGGNVLKLIRVAYAGLTAEGLRVGHYRSLTQWEINTLRDAVKLPRRMVRGKVTKPGRRARSGPKLNRSQKQTRDTSSPPMDTPRKGLQTTADKRSPARSSHQDVDSKPSAGRRAQPTRTTKPDKTSERPGSPARKTAPSRKSEPSKGGRPARQEAPARGRKPARQEAPTRGRKPARQEAPTRGRKPANQEAPARGRKPANQEAPARGRKPANQEAPARGKKPARARPAKDHTPGQGKPTRGKKAPSKKKAPKRR